MTFDTNTAHYMDGGRISKRNKRNAAKSAAKRMPIGKKISDYVKPCQTYPSMPLVDGHGLLMVAMLKRGCQDYVEGSFTEAACALEWLLMDGPIFLEALDIDVEIEDWLIKAATMDIGFDIRGLNVGRYKR